MYQIATNDHAINIKHNATGANRSHFSHALSESVIFHMRAAEPENEVGADITTFSDLSLLLTIIFRPLLLGKLSGHCWILAR